LTDLAQELGIDIERRTTRGRSCPRCGGKIIPSRRAVYQSSGDPNAVFPAWQCERCGYEELVERPIKAPAKHAAKAPAKAAPAQTASTSTAVARPSADKPPAARATPSMKDRKGRELPPDVIRMLTEMGRGEGNNN
jgi:DNA-directed RNA polymerase subunit RPC12/RpoP